MHLITEAQAIRDQLAALQKRLEQDMHGPAGAAEQALVFVQAQLVDVADGIEAVRHQLLRLESGQADGLRIAQPAIVKIGLHHGVDIVEGHRDMIGGGKGLYCRPAYNSRATPSLNAHTTPWPHTTRFPNST